MELSLWNVTTHEFYSHMLLTNVHTFTPVTSVNQNIRSRSYFTIFTSFLETNEACAVLV